MLQFNLHVSAEQKTYDHHHHIKHIPNGSNVSHPVFPDFQCFLDYVVNNEGNKDKFTGHDEVIPCFYIFQQLYCPEFSRRNDATSRREFKDNPTIEIYLQSL